MRLRSSNSKNLPSSTYGLIISCFNKKKTLKIVNFIKCRLHDRTKKLKTWTLRTLAENKQNEKSSVDCFQVIGRKRLKFKMYLDSLFCYYSLIISLFAFYNGICVSLPPQKIDELFIERNLFASRVKFSRVGLFKFRKKLEFFNCWNKQKIKLKTWSFSESFSNKTSSWNSNNLEIPSE